MKNLYPITRTRLLANYQVELENWVESTSLEAIQSYLVSIHGMVYPDDWADFLDNHSNKTATGKNYIQSCEHCQEILLAIKTISEISRPELNTIFKCSKKEG